MNKIIIKQYDEARQLVRKYFMDSNKSLGLLMFISDREGRDYKDKLVIQEGWKWDNDFGSDYNYIRGRVKNTGTMNITYFKIKALYMNKNKEVIDTDFTNSGDTLMPNMAKEFEIMHHDSSDYKYIRIFVDEVHVQ